MAGRKILMNVAVVGYAAVKLRSVIENLSLSVAGTRCCQSSRAESLMMYADRGISTLSNTRRSSVALARNWIVHGDPREIQMIVL